MQLVWSIFASSVKSVSCFYALSLHLFVLCTLFETTQAPASSYSRTNQAQNRLEHPWGIHGHLFSTNIRGYAIHPIQALEGCYVCFVSSQNKANQASGRIEPHKTSTPTKHDNTFVSDTVWSSDRARNTNLATACNCQHTTEKKDAHLDLHEFAYPMFPLQLLKGKHVPTVKGQLLNMFFRLRPCCGPRCATWSLKHLASGPQETKISTWVDILCTALGKRHQKGNLDLCFGDPIFSPQLLNRKMCATWTIWGSVWTVRPFVRAWSLMCHRTPRNLHRTW